MKALLILDMPCSCSDCRFCQYEDLIKSSFCTADPSHMFKMNEEGGVYSMRRDFCCPLRPLPQKKDIDKTLAFGGYENIIQESLARGYNACLEEITK